MPTSDLPTSTATEDRVLACLIDRGIDALLPVIEAGIAATTFADPLARRVFDAVLVAHAAGLPFGYGEVLQRLKPTVEESHELVKFTRTDGGDMMILPRLCSELRDLARRRTIIASSTRLTDAAKNDPDQIAGIIADLLASQAETTKARTWAKICDAATARAQDSIAGKVNTADFISWGFPALDSKFKPMHRGEFVIVAARPSVGKSSLGRQIATAAAIDGRPVLFQSLEVGADDVIDGMATADSGHNAAGLAAAFPAEQARFLRSIATLKAAPLQVCEDRTLAGIIARAKASHAQQPIDLLVIDYLGLLAECRPGKGETTAQAVGQVTKALKRLAMELHIVVVCLAQLNRQSAHDGNREPRLSDLRDSGDIEQDADRVVFIHRPDECTFTQANQSEQHDVADRPRFGCALVQAKGRNVGTANRAVWFHRRLARFEFV